MQVIEEIGSTLENHYEDVEMNFEVKIEDDDEDVEQQSNKKTKKKKTEYETKNVDVTIVKDARALVEEVMVARGLKPETLMCRAVIDGGQGSLKICLSVFDRNTNPQVSSSQEAQGEKLTGVNRLLLLAEVDGGLERHHNVRLLLEHLQLELLPGIVLIGDLCITNVYAGISKHGGKYACYVCEGESTLESGVLRTFGSLERHYLAYVAAGSSRNFLLLLLFCLILLFFPLLLFPLLLFPSCRSQEYEESQECHQPVFAEGQARGAGWGETATARATHPDGGRKPLLPGATEGLAAPCPLRTRQVDRAWPVRWWVGRRQHCTVRLSRPGLTGWEMPFLFQVSEETGRAKEGSASLRSPHPGITGALQGDPEGVLWVDPVHQLLQPDQGVCEVGGDAAVLLPHNPQG